MNIGLRGAFIISAVVHAAIVAPFYNYNLLRNDFVKKDAVIVDYIILSQISNIIAANAPGREAVVISETPKADIKKSPSQDSAALKHDKAYYKRKAEHAGKKGIADTGPALNAVQEADKKQAQIRSSKDYINYYGYLKDRIKARLQGNYRFYKGEGDVYLSFALNAKGVLLAYDIDRSRSTKDEVLLHITSASLKAVAPFSPLPKAISAPKMSFNITISFKR